MTGPDPDRPDVRKTGAIEELQPSGILVDENGDWFHYGNKIFRPEILETLYSKLDQMPTGQFVLADSMGPCPIDVADTPFVVSRVDIDTDGSDRERILICMKNIPGSEVLDLDTLAVGRDNILYCKVLQRRFLARFSRPAYYQLAEFVREDDGGQDFYIELSGKKYPISELK
ncbi:MAG: hypothetical protein ACLQBD_21370 [Syntrophobacteraceae bacterium]